MSVIKFIYEPPGANLDFTTHDSGDASPEEDLIIFWFRYVSPTGTDRIELTLQSGDNDKFYARTHFKVESKPLPASTPGLASLLEVKNAQGELLERTNYVSDSDHSTLLSSISPKIWIASTTDEQFIAFPKSMFYVTPSFDFSDVHRMTFAFQNLNPRASVFMGDVQLVGGGKDQSGGAAGDETRGGVQGTYRYRVTFRNTTTGNRSNPGTVTQIARDVNRGYVQLTGLPTSSDGQVDAREIWRTMGDGTRYFKIAQVADNTTTTFDDQVADYAGLDSASGVTVMSSEELPLDNDVPFADHDQHIIDKLTAFWINSASARSGRVYYSPIGRPESQKGYIDVSSAGDPLQRLIVFQGTRYIFSEAKLYRLVGDDPYIAFEIAGVPGVAPVSKRTVVATPYGICWQANDGIRVYNGARSQLLNFDPVGKLFRGEAAENLSAFEGTVATFARGEYYISDGSQCLAIEVETGSWRDVGFGDLTALFYEWDTDILQGGRASQVELLEEEGTVDDDGAAIDISWETTAGILPHDEVLFIERIMIDADTNGETLTPTLIHQYGTDALATISNSSRSSFEREIQELLLRPGLRITGSVSNKVTVYDVQAEYRAVTLGINIEGQQRRYVTGRWREDLGTNGRIVFEIDATVKFVDQTDELLILDRITIEADTEGTTVTPRIQLENNTVTLAALSTSSARIVNSYQIDRVGAFNELSLDGPFFVDGTRPKIYRIEAHMRPLELGLNSTATGQRGAVMGRSPDPDTGMLFEVQPTQQMFNNLGSLYFIERLVIEADTNGVSITPTFNIGGGSIALDAFSTTTRTYTEFDVERIGPIEDLTLAGDFTGDVQIFGIEVFLRPVRLGIRMPNGERMEVDGKATASGTEIVFDVDPADRRFDAQSYVPLIERLHIDVDSNETDIIPLLTMENQTLVLTTKNTTLRDTLTYDVNYVGRLRNVKLSADFVTNAIKLYGIEIQMRSLELGVNILTNS